MAFGNVPHRVDIREITMFSVTDIIGLDPVMRKILVNTSNAVCGMASTNVKLEWSEKLFVAITNVGITTLGTMKATEMLKAGRYETITFHAME